jgi:hypothetical protein
MREPETSLQQLRAFLLGVAGQQQAAPHWIR